MKVVWLLCALVILQAVALNEGFGGGHHGGRHHEGGLRDRIAHRFRRSHHRMSGHHDSDHHDSSSDDSDHHDSSSDDSDHHDSSSDHSDHHDSSSDHSDHHDSSSSDHSDHHDSSSSDHSDHHDSSSSDHSDHHDDHKFPRARKLLKLALFRRMLTRHHGDHHGDHRFPLARKLLKLALVKRMLTRHHGDHHDSSSSDHSDHHDSSSSDHSDHHDSSSDHSDHHDSSSSSSDHSDDHEFPLARKLLKLAILKRILLRHRGDHSDDDDDHKFPLLRKIIKLALLKRLIASHHDDSSDHSDDHEFPMVKKLLKLAILKKIIAKHHDDDSDDHDDDDDSDDHEFPMLRKIIKLAILKKVLGGGHHHKRGDLLKTLIKAKVLKAIVQKFRDHHDDDDEDDHGHVWNFAMSDDFGAYNYLDNEGHLKGFNVDLMEAVCKKAHKKCHFIEDRTEHCWHNDHIHESPGEGLLDGWYDGCFGFEATPERQNSFNFTEDFTAKEHSSLYFKKGAAKFTDLQGKKIGFVNGWGSSVHCLEREGKKHFTNNAHTDFTAKFYDSHDDLDEGLTKGEVDAVFSEDVFNTDAEVAKGVDQDTHQLYCSDHGEAIMARYDSSLFGWWNKAFHKLESSGEYKKLCEVGAKAHAAHGTIHCA